MRHWLPENSAWKALVSLLFWTTVAYAANTDETATAAETVISGKIDGYRGIWFDLGQKSEFGSKYSGGLGTYTAKHHPLAVYAPEVNKTFFVYGGTPAADQRRLLAMASYYDHEQNRVPRPTVVHDKQGVDDPHDNPSMNIDSDGYIWVFVSGRGRSRPGFIYRSVKPFDTETFELVLEDEFTYPQPWYIQGRGFLHLLTRYTNGRELYWSTSDLEGRTWTQPKKLAAMGGHYQMSNKLGDRVITAFNMHPGGDVDKRTNLYFLQTDDRGATWTTVDGRQLDLPLTEVANPALVWDYASEGRLVYLKDIGFDPEKRPVLLYITSSGYQPGPKGDPRSWTIAHWTGTEWEFHEITRSTHNYDMGSLYIEGDLWKVLAPTEPGPQHYGTGGEMAIWESRDQGKSWKKLRDVTMDSPRNHGYARRPVNAHSDFYAIWADGNPDEMSESHLYFTNRDGDKVWELPYEMSDEFATPERR